MSFCGDSRLGSSWTAFLLGLRRVALVLALDSTGEREPRGTNDRPGTAPRLSEPDPARTSERGIGSARPDLGAGAGYNLA